MGSGITHAISPMRAPQSISWHAESLQGLVELRVLSGKMTESMQRQGIRDESIAASRPQLAVSACGNDDKLLMIDFIGHRSCLSAAGKPAAPEFRTVQHVERSEIVVRRRGDEDHAGTCDNRAAHGRYAVDIPKGPRSGIA